MSSLPGMNDIWLVAEFQDQVLRGDKLADVQSQAPCLWERISLPFPRQLRKALAPPSCLLSPLPIPLPRGKDPGQNIPSTWMPFVAFTCLTPGNNYFHFPRSPHLHILAFAQLPTPPRALFPLHVTCRACPSGIS